MVAAGHVPALVGVAIGIHDEGTPRLQFSAAVLWGLWLGGLPLAATVVALRRPERRAQLGRLVALAAMAAVAVGIAAWLAVVDHDIVGIALVYIPPLQALIWLVQGVALRAHARRTLSA
jgi:hypothetical protein